MAGYGGILTRDPLLMISPMARARGGYTCKCQVFLQFVFHNVQSGSVKDFFRFECSSQFVSAQWNCFALGHLAFAKFCSAWYTALCSTALLQFALLHFVALHNTMWDCTDCYCNLMKAHCSATVMGKKSPVHFLTAANTFLLEVKSIVQKNQRFVIS